MVADASILTKSIHRLWLVAIFLSPGIGDAGFSTYLALIMIREVYNV